jgi:hypothetical protein
MSGRRSSNGRWLSAVALCGLALSGCEGNLASVLIRQMNAPVATGAVCTVPLDPTAQRVAEGTLDVGIRDDYVLNPLLQSSLVSTANPNFGRVETNGSFIEGFVVELRDGSPDGRLIERPFSVYQSTFIPASLGGAPSFNVSSLQVIPPAIGQRLRAEVCVIDRMGVTPTCPVPRIRERVQRVIARLTGFGRTQGNIPIETPTFDFPINICCGCSVTFPSDADQTEMVRPGPDCNSGLPLVSPGLCAPGQDFALDCRACAGSNVEFCQPRGYRAGPTMDANMRLIPNTCPTDL